MDKGRDCDEESSLSGTHANRRVQEAAVTGNCRGGGDAKSTVDTFLPATDKQVLGIPSTGEGPAVKHELISSKNALTLFGTFRHGAENSLALRLVCAVTGGGRENGGRRAGRTEGGEQERQLHRPASPHEVPLVWFPQRQGGPLSAPHKRRPVADKRPSDVSAHALR